MCWATNARSWTDTGGASERPGASSRPGEMAPSVGDLFMFCSFKTNPLASVLWVITQYFYFVLYVIVIYAFYILQISDPPSNRQVYMPSFCRIIAFVKRLGVEMTFSSGFSHLPVSQRHGVAKYVYLQVYRRKSIPNSTWSRRNAIAATRTED